MTATHYGVMTNLPSYPLAAYPPTTPAPQVPPPPRRPKRGRWIAAGLVAAALAAGAAGGVLAGRAIAPTPVAAPAPVPAPVTSAWAPTFGAPETAWCKDYQKVTSRLAAAGEAAGVEHTIDGSMLPASLWSAEQRQANMAYADFLQTWVDGTADLDATAPNPALRTLLATSNHHTSRVVDVIRSGAYTPDDFAEYKTGVIADHALHEDPESLICVIEREVNVFQSGSPLGLLVATFKVC